jgi:organic radical activating enzyme
MQLSTVNSVRLNETFGPTVQGEGPYIGKPCFFIRTQGCPVQCPGCDTAYTWDGTEKGDMHDLGKLYGWAIESLRQFAGCGFVITGGEPLTLFRNVAWKTFLIHLKEQARWISLETSGFIGPNETDRAKDLIEYLQLFDSVSCSPKITPCLHSPHYTDKQLDVNLPWILRAFDSADADIPRHPSDLCFKYVVRDNDDVIAVVDHVRKHSLRARRHPLYLMPYGLEAEEVAEGCRRCVEWCARYGFDLSPRVHALLWGKKRAV